MPNTTETPPTQLEKWLITITVMLSAMIEIIDTTIVNVVLHDMAGSLGASSEGITWVVTSYIVSAAIFMPLTGLLVNIFGRRRLLFINVLGFMVFSVLCGLASNLTEMVIFRIFQGIFGASLVPISMYVLRDTFSPAEQVKAMAIWGIGIMAAPVLGPTLGGYIADSMGWRWIFFINVPVCIITLLMTGMYISETTRKRVRMDWSGLLLMTLVIAALQLFLDRGNNEGWLASNFIIALILIAVVGGGIFIFRGLNTPNHIINLRLFADRDYYAASILMVLYPAALFGMLTIQPLIMQGYMSYDPKLTGLLMAPRGIMAAIAMVFVTPLAKKFDMRYLIAIGILLTAWGTYDYAKISLNADEWAWVYPSLIQGLGMGFFFVPISTMALQSLQKKDIAEASGLFSFTRNIGTSIGISVLVTVMTQQTQAAWNMMSDHIRLDNPNYLQWTEKLGLSPDSPRTLDILSQTIEAQASMIGFVDACYLGFIGLMICLPFVCLLKKPQGGDIEMGH